MKIVVRILKPIITGDEFDELPEQTKLKYLLCNKCGKFFLVHDGNEAKKHVSSTLRRGENYLYFNSITNAEEEVEILHVDSEGVATILTSIGIAYASQKELKACNG